MSFLWVDAHYCPLLFQQRFKLVTLDIFLRYCICTSSLQTSTFLFSEFETFPSFAATDQQSYKIKSCSRSNIWHCTSPFFKQRDSSIRKPVCQTEASWPYKILCRFRLVASYTQHQRIIVGDNSEILCSNLALKVQIWKCLFKLKKISDFIKKMYIKMICLKI